MFIERLFFIIFVSLFIAHNLYADFDFGNKFVDVREAAIKMSADSRSSINEMKNKVSKKSPISNKSSKRVALVIGNKNYSSQTQLKNPINDAKLIKKTLESLDFKVLEAYDADIEKLDKSMDAFIRESRKADVALIYYAGHGIGVEGRNYLVPLGTNNLSKSNLSRKLISLSELQDSVSKAKHFGVVLFDACRNSFFRQNIEGLGNARASRALVRPTLKHTTNILVSFSTQAGTIAKDDVDGGKHSPYALALSEKLKEQKDIRLVMGGVKDKVLQLTNYQQEPIDRSSLGGDEFYLTEEVNGMIIKKVSRENTPKFNPSNISLLTQLGLSDKYAPLKKNNVEFNEIPKGSILITRKNLIFENRTKTLKKGRYYCNIDYNQEYKKINFLIENTTIPKNTILEIMSIKGSRDKYSSGIFSDTKYSENGRIRFNHAAIDEIYCSEPYTESYSGNWDILRFTETTDNAFEIFLEK